MRTLPLLLLASLLAPIASAQEATVPFNGQDIFLNGGNVAWVSFASDIGPGTTRLETFDEIFEEVRANGGNTMRLWLHTSGASTPEWSSSSLGSVVGPGAGAIDDLKAIMDVAWEHEVGLMLCLWSFDMMRTSFGSTITNRSRALLTDDANLQTYIDNALLPMVEAVDGHPALLSWEVFNEAEGMSNELGWDFTQHVPMSDIQRTVNRIAGAIHRADTDALVTTGAVAFHSLSDEQNDSPSIAGRPAESRAAQAAARADALSDREVAVIRDDLSARYDHAFTDEQARATFERLAAVQNYNYYSDARLIDVGGDADGTLDLYTVHYYDWAGTRLSPFHNDVETWRLTKPVAVAEFFLPLSTFGIPFDEMYTTLYRRGYAGALAWQWYDTQRPGLAENWPRALRNMEIMRDTYPDAVTIFTPGPHIVRFESSTPTIEIGSAQSATLEWLVAQSTSVSLDGQSVAESGSLVVTPSATTTYMLTALDADGLADTARVTVAVLPASEINRALFRPATSTTNEQCCGNADPNDAFDGDPSTRWSSEWADTNVDPDNEWLAVDLGLAYDVARVVLNWEDAYGTAYDIQGSLDGHTWTTVFSESAGNGGIDDVGIAGSPSARYVRMQGRDRATEFGFSLWEFEVYGLVSSDQPPMVDLVTPVDGLRIAIGDSIAFSAEASDSDGTIARVDFLADGSVVATSDAAPFAARWAFENTGTYAITAVAVDDQGLTTSTSAISIDVLTPTALRRMEAEGAELTGTVAVQTDADASGGAYASMTDSGAISWTIVADSSATHTLTIGYRLPDGPRSQNLDVNGRILPNLAFQGDTGVWLTRTVRAPLNAGANTIRLLKTGGFLDVDYIELETPMIVANDDGTATSGASSLGANYPDPFAGRTRIPYVLSQPSEVHIDVYDMLGRHVLRLDQGMRSAGEHSATLDAASLASGAYLYRIRAGEWTSARVLTVSR